MKSMLIRSFAVAMLASSISAFASTAPAKDDPPKEEKMSTSCLPADASSQMADQHSKHDKKKEKKMKMKMKKEQKKDDDYNLMGIYG